MIDWPLAGRVGRMVAGEPPGGVALAGDLAALAEDARERVVAYTRLDPQRAIPPPEAVDRKRWLEVNHVSMKTMLDPVAAKLQERRRQPHPAVQAVGGALLGAEIGALTGYLSQRVLGQYELVLLDATAPERLLFLAPNLRIAAEELDVDERDLVAWVAFHEVTHAVQFTGVPWLRDHIGGLLRELLETVDVRVDPTALLRLNMDDLRALVERAKQGGLVTLVAGPERMAILDRVQAVMAVVEGHAEHVMDAVGADALPSLDRLRSALERRRREKPPWMRILEKLIGLELKMRQYELGKSFCDAVVEQGGIEALNRAWRSPADLPDLAELDAPEAWLRRTDVRAA